MRKLLLFLVLFPLGAMGQVFYQLPSPLPNAKMYVCPVPAITNPCTSPSNVFSDQGMTQLITQPIQVGKDGNYGFWTNPGQYTIQIQSPYNLVYVISVGGGSAFVGTSGSSFQDVALIAQPPNPSSGFIRLFGNSTTGNLFCLTSAGANCNPGSGGGGGTVTTITSGSFSPLFNVGITNPSTTPAFTFTPLAFLAHQFYGCSGASGCTPTAVQPNLNDFVGTLLASQMPTFSGDVSNSGLTLTVNKINNTSVPTNAAADQFLGTTGAATAAWAGVPNCGDSSHALAYSTSTHTFSCQNIAAAGGTVTSVGATVPSGFAVSGSPVTTTGTLAFTYSVAGADQTIVSSAANMAGFTSLPSCSTSSSALLYNTTTHTFSCNTISGSGTVNNDAAGLHFAWYPAIGTAVSPNANLTEATNTLTYAGAGGIKAPLFTGTGAGPGCIDLQAGTGLNLATQCAPAGAIGTSYTLTYPTSIAAGTYQIDASGNISFADTTVANGGTGASTETAHGVIIGEGTSPFASTAAGAFDTFLQGQGPAADAAFSAALTTCGDSSHALSYNATTHSFGCQALTTGGSNPPLNTVASANGANTNLTNNSDFAQVWNWQLATAGKVGFTFGENLAGTATGNAVILDAQTLSGSTVNPFQVTAQGTANGVRVNTVGVLAPIGTGHINADQINGTSVPVNSAADQFLGTTASATGAWASVPNCQDTGGQHVNYNTTTHAFSCGATSSSATPLLNVIASATGANTLANGDNPQTWNWALTTSSQNAFTFGETSASTATGTPVLVRIKTLAGSTAIPLQITALGNANGVQVNNAGNLVPMGTGIIQANNVDNSTIALSGTNLQVKAGGVASTQLATANKTRTCSVLIGADNGTALATGDIQPQKSLCLIDVASTVTTVIVLVDAGASTVQIGYRHNGATTAISPVLTPATVTGITDKVACANVGGTAITIEGNSVTCSALTNTALTAFDAIETIGGTADGVSKRLSAFTTFTVN